MVRVKLALACLSHGQCPCSSGLCGFLNPNRGSIPNPKPSPPGCLKKSFGLRQALIRKTRRPQGWGSVTVPMACTLHGQCPWSSGFYSFLNPKPRCNANVKSNPNPRWSLRNNIGLRRAPIRKKIRQQGRGSVALPFACLLHGQCP